MRKLLILSADFTGHGHKSIADAISERLNAYSDVEYTIVDGFDMMSKIEKTMFEKTYGPITRMPGRVWELQFNTGKRFKGTVQRAIAKLIKARFLELLATFKPDAILTVHPMFVGSVIDILRAEKLNIPFLTFEADLIDIAVQWMDPRSTYTFAPSHEAYESSVRGGLPVDRLIEVRLPVRSAFMGKARPFEGLKNPGVVTIMSGSEGSGRLRKVVGRLLKHTSMNVNVICGRNKRLRSKLRKAYGRDYPERLNVMGFMTNIDEVMLESDLLILRASPNSVMEAVALNKPVILFGHLAGQEAHNPDMMVANGLAVYCNDIEALPACINNLVADGGKQIREMIACQKAYMPKDAAVEIAAMLYRVLNGEELKA